MHLNRRAFSRGVAVSTVATSMGLSSLALAQAKKWVTGKDYQVLDPRAPVEALAGKIEVVEFFWYNCPHCHAFEPTLDAWIKRLPKDIAFRRAPVAFRDDFVPQQRLYYALEALGLVGKLHSKVFAAIHTDKIKLDKGETITEWLVAQGVDKAKFTEQYNSFTIASKSTRAAQLQNAYRIEGVPALGVAGRFSTDGAMAGSMERALEIVDSLCAEIRAKG